MSKDAHEEEVNPVQLEMNAIKELVFNIIQGEVTKLKESSILEAVTHKKKLEGAEATAYKAALKRKAKLAHCKEYYPEKYARDKEAALNKFDEFEEVDHMVSKVEG